MSQYIGVDVACETLEVAVTHRKKTKRFPNTPRGISSLRLWLDRFGSLSGQHLVLEPTSIYHHHLVEALVQWEVPYTLINPAHTAAFAKVQGLRAKTDPVDARLLAAYGESQHPAPSSRPDRDQERLRSLRRHREWLEKERRAACNRLDTAQRSPWTSRSVLESLERTMDGLDEELKRIADEEEREVAENPGWSHQVTLLSTIPGIGEKTAVMVVSELPPVSRCARSKSWVAFCGVNPEPRESGKAQWSRLSRKGAARIRAVLYMAAVSSLRCNPHTRALSDRLREKGKPGKVRVLAVMNKLLRMCFGVLKRQQPYDPKWGRPLTI